MIVTDGFVFLHLHKSGGSFVNEFLKRFYPSAREIGYHLPWSLVPESHADLPALGLVRNPWSYYVSWYTFQKQRPRPNALFRLLSDDGSLDFEAIVKRLASHGYEGWFVVEAEQDPVKSPPLQMAKIGHKELLRVMAAAGYTVEN